MVDKKKLDPEVKQYIEDLEHDNGVLQESLTAMRSEFEALTQKLHLYMASLELVKDAQHGSYN